MKRSVTWFLGAVLLAVTASPRSTGADLYVLTNGIADLSGGATTFGKIDTSTGVFTKINIIGAGSDGSGNINGAAGNLARIPDVPGEENFLYFTLGTGTDTILKRLNLSTNEIDGFSTNIGDPGRTIMGMTYANGNSGDTFYAWEQNGDPKDIYGTISPTDGTWQGLSNDPDIAATGIPIGGRLANLNGTIYGAFNADTLGQFGTIGTSGGDVFVVEKVDNLYMNMVLAADFDASTLYGVYGTGTGQRLYTINTTGVGGLVGDLTLVNTIAGAGSFFHGAVFAPTPVPEPSTYALSMIAACTAGWAMRRKKKRS